MQKELTRSIILDKISFIMYLEVLLFEIACVVTVLVCMAVGGGTAFNVGIVATILWLQPLWWVIVNWKGNMHTAFALLRNDIEIITATCVARDSRTLSSSTEATGIFDTDYYEIYALEPTTTYPPSFIPLFGKGCRDKRLRNKWAKYPTVGGDNGNTALRIWGGGTVYLIRTGKVLHLFSADYVYISRDNPLAQYINYSYCVEQPIREPVQYNQY